MSKLWKTKSLWIERTKNIFIHFLNCECADVAVAVCVCLFECLGVWGFAISTHDINLSFACANTCLAPISTSCIVQVHNLQSSLLVKCMKKLTLALFDSIFGLRNRSICLFEFWIWAFTYAMALSHYFFNLHNNTLHYTSDDHLIDRRRKKQIYYGFAYNSVTPIKEVCACFSLLLFYFIISVFLQLFVAKRYFIDVLYLTMHVILNSSPNFWFRFLENVCFFHWNQNGLLISHRCSKKMLLEKIFAERKMELSKCSTDVTDFES